LLQTLAHLDAGSGSRYNTFGGTNDTTFSQIVASAGYTFNPSTGNTVTIGLPSGTSASTWS
jgi:hypothetical protein